MCFKIYELTSFSNLQEYEDKVAKLKEEYHEAMKKYKASGGGIEASSSSVKSKSKSSPKKSAPQVKNPISKEFIEDSDSSDSGSDKKSKVSIKTILELITE